MLERSKKLRTRQVFSNFTDQIFTKFQSVSEVMLKWEFLTFYVKMSHYDLGRSNQKIKAYADNEREMIVN